MALRTGINAYLACDPIANRGISYGDAPTGCTHRTFVKRSRTLGAPADWSILHRLRSIIRSGLYLLRVIFVVYLEGGNSIRNKAKGLIRPHMILLQLLRAHVGISP